MEYRGPILLVFGASLIMSPIAVHVALEDQAPRSRASYVQTEGGANSTCTAASMLKMGDDPGCRPSNGNVATRRVMEGGAVFLSARR